MARCRVAAHMSDAERFRQQLAEKRICENWPGARVIDG